MKNNQLLNHENLIVSDPNSSTSDSDVAPRNSSRIGHYAANILVSGVVLLAGVSQNSHHSEHFPALPMPVPDKVCTPAPSFDGVGIADNKAIVKQADKLPRSDVLVLAKRDLDAHIVSIDVDFGQWENKNLRARNKYRSNITSTVKTANSLGDQVEVTDEQTPEYEPNLNRALSYWNSSPTAMASFSYSVASTLGNSVLSYSPENAPNNTKEFSKTGSMKDYDAVEIAGFKAIKEADPKAQVWVGQLDPMGNIKAWIMNLITLPSNGIALHSYQLLNNTHTYVEEANRQSNKKAKDAKSSNIPVYITEYGDPASDPRQRLNLKMATITARCDGASGIVDYQFIKTPNEDFNTGIITIKQAIAESGGTAYKADNIKAEAQTSTLDSHEFILAH